MVKQKIRKIDLLYPQILNFIIELFFLMKNLQQQIMKSNQVMICQIFQIINFDTNLYNKILSASKVLNPAQNQYFTTKGDHLQIKSFIFQSKYQSITMEIDINNIDFAIAVNTFHDDIEDKLQILNKIELQFLRKFEHRVQISQHHSQMIYQIRKIVSNIQQMYKDIKDYFVQMNVQFVYHFIRKIQTLMVIGYNHLSQALLITFDMYQTQRKRQKQIKSINCTCQSKSNYILTKDQLKKLQHIDYTINNLQNQQERLLMEMQTIYDRMIMQKTLIQKVKPSLATKQLQQMKDHIQTVMENNQKLFEETYMMKFFQFHNHIKKLDKPQKITEVYHKINDTLKQNFVKQTIKTASRIQRARRHNQQNMVSAQVQTMDYNHKSRTRKDLSLGKQSGPTVVFKQSTTSHYSLAKQRKLNQKMNIELNHLQKQNIALVEELNSYRFAQQQIQVKYRELLQKFDIVEAMYKKTKIELEQVKGDKQWTMQKLQLQNNRIKQQLSVLRVRNIQGSVQTVSIQIQTDRIVNRTGSRTYQTGLINYDITVQQKQIQTYDQYLLPSNDDEVIKLLKNRNQKAIVMLNDKDRKIRQSTNKIVLLQDQTNKIKSTLNIFVGLVEEKFTGTADATNINNNIKDNSIQSCKLNTNLINKKKSILQMNSYQINQKIKQVLKLIIPPTNHHQTNQQQLPSMDRNKFKKLTSVNQKHFNTLPNQDSQNQIDSVHQLPNAQSNSNFSKTFSDLKHQYQDNKKKKRLSAWNIIANKKNLLLKNNVQTQTQLPNQNHKLQKGHTTKQIQTQTIIDDNKQKSIKKHQIRNSIQNNKIQKLYQKGLSTNRRRKNLPSCRNSQTAIQHRHKDLDYKKNLNTFQKITINNGFKLQGDNSQNKYIKNNLFQAHQSNRKMISTLPFDFRKQKILNQAQKNKQDGISPFINQRDQQNTQRLSSLLDDSMQADKMKSKYIQLINENPNNTIKNFNVKQKSKQKKISHNRLASQMTSTFRPISQVSQQEKENDYINIAYCPHNTYSGINFQNIQLDTKLALTSTQPFTKFKAEQLRIERNDSKKKSLLLSIQKYKSDTTSLNEILLGKYLAKVMQKWGKQKVKQTLNNMLVQAKS